MSIYIALHKKAELPEIEGYIPIQVGAALHDDLGYLRDDSGDNISVKNPNYCELTALYWVWKNAEKTDVMGLVHYRRFFTRKKMEKILSIDECKVILQDYDIILPQKWYFKNNVREHYAKMHHIDDLMKCGEIISDDFPEYTDAFNEVLGRRYLYLFNMFVMREKEFNDYMEWLFHILFKLEQIVDISDYEDYNKRIYGFLSERLFNVWILKNKLKIKSVKVYNNEATFKEKLDLKVKNSVKRILSFLKV